MAKKPLLLTAGLIALGAAFLLTCLRNAREPEAPADAENLSAGRPDGADSVASANDIDRLLKRGGDIIEDRIRGDDYELSRMVGWDETMDRIGDQIQTLNGETMEESLANLKRVTFYFWPGAVRDAARVMELPLPEDIDQFDVDTILSNRRFLKLYSDLKQMEASDAAAIVNSELTEGLIEYKGLYETLINEKGPQYPPTMPMDGPVMGLVFQLEDGEEESTLILGARYRVLSLALLASQLELTGVHNKILEIVQYGMEQRNLIYSDTAHHMIFKFDLLTGASLYNRQILATAAHFTADERKSMPASLIRKKLTAYDALLTPYDQPSRIGALPIDYSKGGDRYKLPRTHG